MVDSEAKKLSRRRLLKRIGYGGAALAVFGGYQAFDDDVIEVEKHTLQLPRWNADGFKVAFLTDMHIDGPQMLRRMKRAVEIAVSHKPDVILIGGDNFTYRESFESSMWRDPLGMIADSRIPAFNILGNHEYGIRGRTEIFDTLGRAPVRLLRNEIAEVDGVNIFGFDDGNNRMDRHDLLGPAHEKNMIALFHEPDWVERIDERFSVQLSGHSHGGQVCLPFGIPVHTPVGSKKYKKGFYRDAKVPLYVSRGLATVGVPMRVNCPPEVSILTLRSV